MNSCTDKKPAVLRSVTRNFLILILLIPTVTVSQVPFDYLPKTGSDRYQKSYKEFTVSYSNKYRQPLWVAYELNRTELQQNVRRTNNFRIDKSIGTQWATLRDYKGSGYHRGHICRANYCKSSITAYKESFYLSNISPQLPGFNSGGGNWYNLELLEENYALVKNRIYAVSGPVFKDNIDAIGRNNLIVAGYFYKAFLCPDLTHAIGFLLPHNENKVTDLLQFAITIDSLETFTGIDFFYKLEDKAEDKIESTINMKCWAPPAKNEVERIKSNSIKSTEAPLSQCRAIAKSSSLRCKRTTTNESGYCWQHEDNKE